ncbi:hypothetical protein VaNZ11_001941 [Volvox africanus]|uniref:Btz domain-containing protein n=1 Tax=Volvox africanus TaxID=51714 RepID=A0ABQ5RSB0_9CHLO|nr:hypothetical protein VaNZ11_001941 [Volvox africanus]
MSTSILEDEAVLDVKVPTRRRRASDDEAEEVEFHDAAEYAASVADSQAVDQEEQGADEPRSEDGYEGIIAPTAEGAEDENVGETEEHPSEHDQPEDSAVDRKKAKLREPFEVPTSGAFWLHDDRFGGEEPKAEPSRPGGGAAERKARSDTEGRWLHDKFSTLELDDVAEDDSSDNVFLQYRRGRGRGLRGGGRRGGISGGRSPLTAGSRGRGVSAGRGRVGRPASNHIDEIISDLGNSGALPSQGRPEIQEALPQRPQRAPRAAKRSAAAPPSSYSENSGAEAAELAAASASPGPGRGRGSGARGGRNGEFSGRGRNERSFSPDAGHRERGSEPDFGSGGRGRESSGRGRRREDGGRASSVLGRDDSGRGPGRGYGRGMDPYESGRTLEAIRGSEVISSNGGTYESRRGRGRGAGRVTADDYQDRGPGSGRGQSSTQRTQQAGQQQQQRRQERSVDEEFPPLPSSATARKPAAAPSPNADMPPGVGGNIVAMDAAATATQGVRRYSKMAGKVGGGGSSVPDSSAGTGGGAAAAPESVHARGAGADGGGAAPRASKLSAAAATFEPSPAAAAAATGRQLAASPPQPALMPQQPVPSVPAAFGAPLQPMTVVGVASEQYSAGMPPQHGQHMPYVQSQQQHTQAQAQPVPGVYGGPMQQQVTMPPQGIAGGEGSPMAPSLQNMPYTSTGTIMYGAPSAEVEAWYQDAYQKALAIGMDPQQAYSAVQGYVQGLKMAAAVVEQQRWQQQQQMSGYAGVLPPQQMPTPPAGPAPYEAPKPVT